jgi:phage shock protein A
MQWLQTFSLVIRTNLSTFIERFEDPERVLNQLLIDMEEELERVRANTAGVIADEIQLGKKVEQARADARHWHDRAGQAMQRGEEATARAALEQKLVADRRAAALEQEHRQHQEQTAKLHEAVRDLEAKIRQATHRRALLLARLTRAESAQNIRDVLRRVDSTSALSQFHRLEERAQRAEAMDEALDRMAGRDPHAEELERQFQEQEEKERLQREFDELKRRLQPED